jgi:hypothetical protein
LSKTGEFDDNIEKGALPFIFLLWNRLRESGFYLVPIEHPEFRVLCFFCDPGAQYS